MAGKLKHIFLVEDSETHLEMIREALLEWRGDLLLTTASSLAEAKAILKETTPDLALVDFFLPDGKGTELLRGDREDGPDFPLVLMTGSGDEQVAVAAMKGGALDYVVKSPESLAELPRLVTRTMREWQQICRRQAAEELLRRSEEKYRQLFANMREAVAVDELLRDRKGNPVDWRIMDVNRAYEKLFGFCRGEVVGKRASQLYKDDLDVPTLVKIMARVAETGESKRVELHFRRTDRYLLTSVFRTGTNQFATLAIDITERKRAAAERERLLAELQAIIQAIADAVVIVERDGRIRDMNPAAKSLLGITTSEHGQSFRESFSRFRVETPERTRFPLEETMRRVAQGETIRGIIVVLRRSGEKDRWLSCSAAPIRTSGGEVGGGVATFTDITPLRDLQEQQDLYLHTVSHDMRTPLTVIQGHAQLLEAMGDGRSEGFGQHVDSILHGARRMTGLIQDLVDTARMEGGEIHLNLTALELKPFLKDLLRRLGAALDLGGIELDVPEELPAVAADPGRLERIITNLLTNAVKFSPSESPISLSVQRREDHVEVAVKDRGAGIAPEDQPRIFERFYRPRGQRRADSVGLGLYISRMLVEAHGGTIRVNSQPDRGSTFTFTLPLV